jgi:hypothetical protein
VVVLVPTVVRLPEVLPELVLLMPPLELTVPPELDVPLPELVLLMPPLELTVPPVLDVLLLELLLVLLLVLELEELVVPPLLPPPPDIRPGAACVRAPSPLLAKSP